MTQQGDRIVCIYHGNCADGFTAAWAVWKRFPDAVFHPGIYGAPPPDVKGAHVIIVDFSYKADVLEEMAKAARSILILDHHKTAHEDIFGRDRIGCTKPVDLSKYTGALTWQRHFDNVTQDEIEGCSTAVIYALIDMKRSGAMLAWNFFHCANAPPRLLEHVQDRDLWKFALDGTRAAQAALFSYPYDFKVWDDLMHAPVSRLIEEGTAIERKHHKDIAELTKVCRRWMTIGGYRVPVVNLPYTMASDACAALCQQPLEGGQLPAFAASYWDGPTARTFSLRSQGEFDVSAVAGKYGGGGHKNAAGFRRALNWEGDISI